MKLIWIISLLFIFVDCAMSFDKRSEEIADKVTSAANILFCSHEIKAIQSSKHSFEHPIFKSLIEKTKLIWQLNQAGGEVYSHFSVSGFAEPNVVAVKILEMYKNRLNGKVQPVDIILRRYPSKASDEDNKRALQEFNTFR